MSAKTHLELKHILHIIEFLLVSVFPRESVSPLTRAGAVSRCQLISAEVYDVTSSLTEGVVTLGPSLPLARGVSVWYVSPGAEFLEGLLVVLGAQP